MTSITLITLRHLSHWALMEYQLRTLWLVWLKSMVLKHFPSLGNKSRSWGLSVMQSSREDNFLHLKDETMFYQEILEMWFKFIPVVANGMPVIALTFFNLIWTCWQDNRPLLWCTLVPSKPCLHWQLIQAYNEIITTEDGCFEIILVSTDRDLNEFNTNLSNMP